MDELLALLGLDPAAYRGRYPHQLSGGQQQRVGVARALAARARGAADGRALRRARSADRQTLQHELARIQRRLGSTIVLVTHDIDEALLLGQRLVLLERGRIVQAGTPLQLLAHPASPA